MKGAVKFVRLAVTLLLLYIYLSLVLSFFPWTGEIVDQLWNYVLDPLKLIGKGTLAYLPHLIFIAVVVLAVNFLLKTVHLFFDGIRRRVIVLSGFHQDWANPTYIIVRFIIIAFTVIIIFPYLPGSDAPAFKGVSVFLGLLLFLGSDSAVANVVAGVIITYMRPFQLGDRVKISDTLGDVMEKSMLVTRILTVKNEMVTIPNAMVLSSHIINYSSSAKDVGLILHTSVTLGYDAPWRKAHELLIAAAKTTDHVLAEPKPFVLQTALGDFNVDYQINAYTNRPDLMMGIYSDLHQNIQDQFNQAGAEILSPHYANLRDGNHTTIPAENLPKDYRAPGFKVAEILPRAPIKNLIRESVESGRHFCRARTA